MGKNWVAGAVIGLVVALAAVVAIGGLFLVGLLVPYRVEGSAPPPVETVIPSPEPVQQAPDEGPQTEGESGRNRHGAGQTLAELALTGQVHTHAAAAASQTGQNQTNGQPQPPAGQPPTGQGQSDTSSHLTQGHPEDPHIPVGLAQAPTTHADSPQAPAHTTPAPLQPAPAAHPLADYQPIPVDPVEPLLPAQPIYLPAQWQGLNQLVYEIAADYPGRLSVVAVDLTSGSRYEFRPSDPYLPASTFKLPVTLCVLEEIAAGSLAWDTPVTYTQEDAEPVGAGGFATSPIGSKWSVRNLVDRSIISSNNVAVKMLARTLTWDGLLNCTTEIGGPVTRTEDGSTPVTASYEAAWWMHLWRTSQERPELAEELLRPLRQVTYYGRIQAGTPRPDLVTHKFGTYAGYDHDGAIVWAERPYILVVMTHGSSEYQADVAIERIAAAAWTAVMEQGE